MTSPSNNTIAENQATAKFLFRLTGLAFVCLLLTLLPIPREQEFLFAFLRAGGLSGAIVLSWIAAGTSIWAAIRVRKRQVVVAALLSVPLAFASTAYAYYFTVW